MSAVSTAVPRVVVGDDHVVVTGREHRGQHAVNVAVGEAVGGIWRDVPNERAQAAGRASNIGAGEPWATSTCACGRKTARYSVNSAVAAGSMRYQPSGST
jgi:hypothetical protein